MAVNPNPRTITNEDIKRYKPMVENYIRKSVCKNWKEASTAKSKDEVSLGNTGMTIADIRQYLLTEVFVVLRKYDPNYRTAEGKPVQESTLVFRHIQNRGGQMCKRLVKKRLGYGVWSVPLEKALGEDMGDD